MAPVGEPSHQVTRTRGVRIGLRPSSPPVWLEPGGQLVRQGLALAPVVVRVRQSQSYSCRWLGATSGAGPDARRPEVLSGRLQFVGLVNNAGHRRHGVIPSTRADSRFLLVLKSHGDSRAGRLVRFRPAEETPNRRFDSWSRCPIFWHPPTHHAQRNLSFRGCSWAEPGTQAQARVGLLPSWVLGSSNECYQKSMGAGERPKFQIRYLNYNNNGRS